jgi:hypothetical protein
MAIRVRDECDVSIGLKFAKGQKRDQSLPDTRFVVFIYEEIPPTRLEMNRKCEVAFGPDHPLLAGLIVKTVFDKRLGNLPAGRKIYLSR